MHNNRPRVNGATLFSDKSSVTSKNTHISQCTRSGDDGGGGVVVLIVVVGSIAILTIASMYLIIKHEMTTNEN